MRVTTGFTLSSQFTSPFFSMGLHSSQAIIPFYSLSCFLLLYVSFLFGIWTFISLFFCHFIYRFLSYICCFCFLLIFVASFFLLLYNVAILCILYIVSFLLHFEFIYFFLLLYISSFLLFYTAFPFFSCYMQFPSSPFTIHFFHYLDVCNSPQLPLTCCSPFLSFYMSFFFILYTPFLFLFFFWGGRSFYMAFIFLSFYTCFSSLSSC